MATFNELIKNFDKIREYMRTFAIYGYKTREDFTHKSARTYDNERRRIQSYLGHYIDEQTSAQGKKLSIHFDSMLLASNPLFEGFKTKSFTKNDIMLHFILLDLLQIHPTLTLSELYEKLLTDYLDRFQLEKIIDNRTLRLKLAEYVSLGLLREEKEGKVIYYSFISSPLTTLSEHTITALNHALTFYQNIAPLGILGHLILEQSPNFKSYFTFRDIHFSHTLDDLILYELLLAMAHHKHIEITHAGSKVSTVLPLKIVDNVDQGRRYVMAYSYKSREYKFFRLDRIVAASTLHTVDDHFNQKLSIINILLNSSWGVSFKTIDAPIALDTWELSLSIDEDFEKPLIHKIETFHKEGHFQRISKNTFSYTISVLEANEMVPWLRQFIGRIIWINCTNKEVLQRFKRDVDLMYAYYEEDRDVII